MQLITLDLFEAKELLSCFGRTSPECCPSETTPSDVSWRESLEQTLPCRPEQTATNGQLVVMLPARNAKRRGASSMLNTSESPRDVVVSSLSQVLETTSIHPKYFLSSTACLGILKRASKRGKQLPESLKKALINQVRSGELYGARGISVCKEWHNFPVFEKWAKESGWRLGLEIDRINNDKGYSPSNCRVVDRKNNMRNTSVNHKVMFKGEMRCLAEIAEMSGLRYDTVHSRMRYGWPPERLGDPVRYVRNKNK